MRSLCRTANIRPGEEVIAVTPKMLLSNAKVRGPPLEYLGGGAGGFFKNKYFGAINKWLQGMVEINILSTKEVEVNII